MYLETFHISNMKPNLIKYESDFAWSTIVCLILPANQNYDAPLGYFYPIGVTLPRPVCGHLYRILY